MTDDAALLRRYASERSEEAFAELVQRHLNLVYRSALRQLGGDAHRAEDVTQSVFALLAHKAAPLSGHPNLTGWLYTTTHLTVSRVRRTERRRQDREQEAQTMHELSSDAALPANWDRVRPVLDSVMQDLNQSDREVILLRFFEERPFAQIGAKLSLSEDAARMRVERALVHLRTSLSSLGVTSTTAALALALTSEAVAAVPSGLAATVTNTALARAAAMTVSVSGGTTTTLNFFHLMSTTKTIAIFATAAAFLAIGTAFYEYGEIRRVSSAAAIGEGDLQKRLAAAAEENRKLHAQTAFLQERVAALIADNIAQHRAAASAQVSTGSLDQLHFLADLQQKKLATIRLPIIANGSSKLQAGFTQLFNLTPEETEALQQAIDRALQQTGQLAAANASVSRRSDGAVLISVPPLDAGNAIRDGLMDTFAQVLGPDRIQTLLALEGSGLGEFTTAMGAYGTLQRTIILSRTATPDGSKQTISARDEQSDPMNNGMSSQTFTTIPEILNWTLALVPQDF